MDQINAEGAHLEELAEQGLDALEESRNQVWIIPTALAFWRAKEYEKSMSVLDRAEGSIVLSVDYQMMKGMVSRRLPNKKADAFIYYKNAAILEPARGDIYYNIGNLMRDDLEKPEIAVKSYQLSLKCDPDNSKTWLNYALTLNEIDSHSEAILAYHKGICLDPKNADAWCNTGLSYYALEQFKQAIRFFNYSLALDSDCSAPYVNIANSHLELCQPEKALPYLQKGITWEAIEAKEKTGSPTHNSLWNLALVRLLLGQFKEGWELYEARFSTKQFSKFTVPSSGKRIIKLEDIPSSVMDSGEEIIVWSEQGMGDSIQFCRYLLLFDDMGINYKYISRPPLHDLMRDWLGLGDRVLEANSTDPENDFRAHIPLLSLPHLFNTQLENVPGFTPYIKSPGQIPDNLIVKTPPGGISIGITWATNRDNKAMYKNKTIPLEILMKPLLKLMDLDLIDLHSIQIGSDASHLEPWKYHPRLNDWNGKVKNFSDTAYVLEQLDLIISVDTGVAHLAGALNKPTWLLLCANADFRWLQHRNDCPWYPSMRLFRQTKRRDWDSVVDQLQLALDELFILDIEGLWSSRSSSQLRTA